MIGNTELTEELEELKTEKEMLLRSLDCADDTGISSVKKDIAAMEGITPSQAGKSIHAALRRLRRYFIRRKWTSGL